MCIHGYLLVLLLAQLVMTCHWLLLRHHLLLLRRGGRLRLRVLLCHNGLLCDNLRLGWLSCRVVELHARVVVVVVGDRACVIWRLWCIATIRCEIFVRAELRGHLMVLAIVRGFQVGRHRCRICRICVIMCTSGSILLLSPAVATVPFLMLLRRARRRVARSRWRLLLV